MRAFLDTNIVYDMLCQRPFDQEAIVRLKVMHAFGDVELWASSKSYTDLFYLIRKELGGDEAQELLESSLEWLQPCSVDGDDLHAALHARWTDFEDCLVNEGARKVKADYLITRDAKGFSASRIPHGSANEFMEFVFEQTNVRYALE